jgi:hypothetical protein
LVIAPDSAARPLQAVIIRAVLTKLENARKARFIEVFEQSTNIMNAFEQILGPAIITRQTLVDLARYGVAARSRTLHPAKMLVFLSRCSNPNTVFAIPAGTEQVATHSG